MACDMFMCYLVRGGGGGGLQGCGLGVRAGEGRVWCVPATTAYIDPENVLPQIQYSGIRTFSHPLTFSPLCYVKA